MRLYKKKKKIIHSQDRTFVYWDSWGSNYNKCKLITFIPKNWGTEASLYFILMKGGH